jgi:hypothetical protein
VRLVIIAALAAALLVPSAIEAKQVPRPAHYSLWMCVHTQERTAWNDDGSPYWGGLQMGSWFISTYAHPPGMPHQWTPLQQMWVAENAYRREHYSRSWLWGQWPPSRGVCF